MNKLFTAKANPIILKTTDFQTIIVRVLFPCSQKEKEAAEEAMLSRMLLFFCEKYKTEESMTKARMKNYVQNMSAGIRRVGTTLFFTFELIMPTPSVVKEDFLESALELFHDTVFHPKVEDNHFDLFEFERRKKSLRMAIENDKKTMDGYFGDIIQTSVDTNGVLTRSISFHLDQLDALTASDLYKFYKEKVANNTPLVFVRGNVDEQELTPLLQKYFKQDGKTITFEKNYNTYLAPTRSTPQEIEEKKDFEQSGLAYIYKIDNMKEEDEYYLTIIKSLLVSRSTNLLNKILREEEKLVYRSGVGINYNCGLFEINAYIKKENKERAKECIEEVMNQLTKEEVVAPLLESYKEKFRLNLLRNLDSNAFLLNDYIDSYLEIWIDAQSDYERTCNTTAKEITTFMERFKLDTICFLEEGDHDKN